MSSRPCFEFSFYVFLEGTLWADAAHADLCPPQKEASSLPPAPHRTAVTTAAAHARSRASRRTCRGYRLPGRVNGGREEGGDDLRLVVSCVTFSLICFSLSSLCSLSVVVVSAPSHPLPLDRGNHTRHNACVHRRRWIRRRWVRHPPSPLPFTAATKALEAHS